MKNGVKSEIPRWAIYRLSVYSRCLSRLKVQGTKTVSSEDLSHAAGVKPTQLRKDLTYFGQFGTRGLGYDVEQLSEMISNLLGSNGLQPVILVGLGHLGMALLSYHGFEQEGFEIVATFDVDTQRGRGKELENPIFPLERLPTYVPDKGVKMAILAVPASAAQEVADLVVRSAITGILNFAPIVLQTPNEVRVNNVNLAIELENLSYFIKK